MDKRIKHGFSQSPGYMLWHSMICRCYRPENQNYVYYGAKGITVCDEWCESPSKFYQDMGPRPSSNHTLDRIDGTKGYSKENCRWVTWKDNNQNRCNSLVFDFRGERLGLKDIAARVGLKYHTLRHRIKSAGLSLEEAISRPTR